MKAIARCFVLLIMSAISVAQPPKAAHVTGKIMGANGKFAPGAKVLLIHLNTLQTWSMNTDQNGSFEFFVHAAPSIPEYEILASGGSACLSRAEKRFKPKTEEGDYKIDLKLKSLGRCIMD